MRFSKTLKSLLFSHYVIVRLFGDGQKDILDKSVWPSPNQEILNMLRFLGHAQMFCGKRIKTHSILLIQFMKFEYVTPTVV